MIKGDLSLVLVFVVVGGLSSCSTHRSSEAEVNTSAVVLDSSEVNSNIEYFRVSHHMVECEGYHVSHCFLVQREGDEQWSFFYDPIEGFDYQWGSDYEILVQVQEVDAVFADASNRRYTLLDIIDEQKHDSTEAFNYKSRKSSERITELGLDRFSLLGRKDFTCEHEVCDLVRSAIAQNQSALLSFQHRADASDPLKLTAVLCSDSEVSFAESCL